MRHYIIFKNHIYYYVQVVALSTGDDKEKMAKELGAKHYININKKDAAAELQKLGGASLIVATAPHANAINPLVKGLKVFNLLYFFYIIYYIPVVLLFIWLFVYSFTCSFIRLFIHSLNH